VPQGSGAVLNGSGAPLTVALVLEGALTLVAIAVGWAVEIDPFRTLHLSWSAVAASAAATVPPLLLLRWLLVTDRERFARLRGMVDRVLGDWVGTAGLPALILLALLAGVGEEALFRGLLQEGASIMVGGILGWLGASVVFGLLHFLTPLYAILATGVGLYLGACYALSGNLLVPLVVHAAYDAAALVALARRPRVPAVAENPPPTE